MNDIKEQLDSTIDNANAALNSAVIDLNAEIDLTAETAVNDVKAKIDATTEEAVQRIEEHVADAIDTIEQQHTFLATKVELNDGLALKADTSVVNAALADKADKITVADDLTLKAPLESPSFTGVPTAPTAPAGTDTTQLATAGFVKNAVDDMRLALIEYINSIIPLTG